MQGTKGGVVSMTEGPPSGPPTWGKALDADMTGIPLHKGRTAHQQGMSLSFQKYVPREPSCTVKDITSLGDGPYDDSHVSPLCDLPYTQTPSNHMMPPAIFIITSTSGLEDCPLWGASDLPCQDGRLQYA